MLGKWAKSEWDFIEKMDTDMHVESQLMRLVTKCNHLNTPMNFTIYSGSTTKHKLPWEHSRKKYIFSCKYLSLCVVLLAFRTFMCTNYGCVPLSACWLLQPCHHCCTWWGHHLHAQEFRNQSEWKKRERQRHLLWFSLRAFPVVWAPPQARRTSTAVRTLHSLRHMKIPCALSMECQNAVLTVYVTRAHIQLPVSFTSAVTSSVSCGTCCWANHKRFVSPSREVEKHVFYFIYKCILRLYLESLSCS